MRDPLFIISLGRSGSTLLHHVLSNHPDVTWLSRLCDWYPHRPERNAFVMRLLKAPGGAVLRRGPLLPTEPYGFWDHYCPGFSRPCRDLRSTDVTPRTRRLVRNAFARARPGGKRQLVAKITGWPRINFLQEIFPESRFIVLLRDGRALLASALSRPWIEPWIGPGNWMWGDLSEPEREAWERSGQSFVLLGAIGWTHLTQAFSEATAKVPADKLLEIRYEDLCQDPNSVLQGATEFAGLDWPTKYARTVESLDLKVQNHRWREDLSDAQQQELESYMRQDLETQGYL